MQKNMFNVGRAVVITALAVTVILSGQFAAAQTFTNQRSVGGIAIDANGMMENAQQDALGELNKLRTEALQALPEDLSKSCKMRKVSLRGLALAVENAKKTGQPIPDAAKYMAGLTRIEFVLIYPEQKDIVLAGPAEGWKVDANGNVVGSETNQPIMLLDDLMVALRSTMDARNGGISCSIDPTQQGLANMNRLMSQLRTIGNPEMTKAAIENAMGPQTITLDGVPATSHFARVLVAADYRMKRIAMGFEPSPVAGIPCYLNMIKTASKSMSTPRWWLEPNYEPILHSADKLAWCLQGASVKAMTEHDVAAANGQIQHTGRANSLAQKWADSMTANYGDLAVASPVFGQLQNCMDMAIVAALVVAEDMKTRAGGCDISSLFSDEIAPVEEYFVPENVGTKSTLVKKRGGWVISASGGVMLNSWGIMSNRKQINGPTPLRTDSARPADAKSFYWN